MTGIVFKLEPGPVWFSGDDGIFDEAFEDSPFNKEDRALIEFLIKPISRDEYRGLEAKFTKKKKVANTRAGMQQFIEEIDEQGRSDEFFENQLLEWRGILGEDYEPLPCNSENKQIIGNYYPGLQMAIIGASTIAAMRQQEVVGEVEKNLPNSQNGISEEKEK